MKRYRITKYNPSLRDDKDGFQGTEWTSFDDIGRPFSGIVLTSKDYEKNETAYINTILAFIEGNGESALIIGELEINKRAILDNSEVSEYYNGQEVLAGEIPYICQCILREYVWCKLTGSHMFVHFGYDYYMYIGSRWTPSEETLVQITRSGLYIESKESRYYITPEP